MLYLQRIPVKCPGQEFMTRARPPPPAGASSSSCSLSPTLGLWTHEVFSCLRLRLSSLQFPVETAGRQDTSVHHGWPPCCLPSRILWVTLVLSSSPRWHLEPTVSPAIHLEWLPSVCVGGWRGVHTSLCLHPVLTSAAWPASLRRAALTRSHFTDL